MEVQTTNSEETCLVTQRIINVWNGLLGKVVEEKAVGSFKKQLDAVLGEML